MSFSFIYLRNAELCSEMAAKTKSVEVREQWLALANSWHKKAEGNEVFRAGAQHREPVWKTPPTQVDFPVIQSVQEPVSVVPERLYPTSSVAKTDALSIECPVPQQKQHFVPVDEFWAGMIAEIRGR